MESRVSTDIGQSASDSGATLAESRRWRYGGKLELLAGAALAGLVYPIAGRGAWLGDTVPSTCRLRTHAEGLVPVSRMKARENAGWLP